MRLSRASALTWSSLRVNCCAIPTGPCVLPRSSIMTWRGRRSIHEPNSRGVACIMLEREYDIVIIGGGIVGLATAMELLTRYPARKLLVLGKEDVLAQQQSRH